MRGVQTNLELLKVRHEQQARDRALQRQLDREQEEQERASLATRVNPVEGDLNENNVGAQMLSRLGWRPGEGIGTGLARLAKTVAEHHRTDAAGSLDPLLTAMLQGERRDDVCVLDIRVPRETA